MNNKEQYMLWINTMYENMGYDFSKKTILETQEGKQQILCLLKLTEIHIKEKR